MLIVWHHLALYEPVLVVLNLRLPVLTDSRQDDGCMAAQVFLIRNSGRGAGWSLLMSWLAGITLSLDFRARLLVGFVVALGLVFFVAPGVKA